MAVAVVSMGLVAFFTGALKHQDCNIFWLQLYHWLLFAGHNTFVPSACQGVQSYLASR